MRSRKAPGKIEANGPPPISGLLQAGDGGCAQMKEHRTTGSEKGQSSQTSAATGVSRISSTTLLSLYLAGSLMVE